MGFERGGGWHARSYYIHIGRVYVNLRCPRLAAHPGSNSFKNLISHPSCPPLIGNWALSGTETFLEPRKSVPGNMLSAQHVNVLRPAPRRQGKLIKCAADPANRLRKPRETQPVNDRSIDPFFHELWFFLRVAGMHGFGIDIAT